MNLKSNLDFFFFCPFVKGHCFSVSVNVLEIQVAGIAEMLCEMTYSYLQVIEF